MVPCISSTLPKTFLSLHTFLRLSLSLLGRVQNLLVPGVGVSDTGLWLFFTYRCYGVATFFLGRLRGLYFFSDFHATGFGLFFGQTTGFTLFFRSPGYGVVCWTLIQRDGVYTFFWLVLRGWNFFLIGFTGFWLFFSERRDWVNTFFCRFFRNTDPRYR